MAKRSRKSKASAEELAQIEADRLEAHGEAAVASEASDVTDVNPNHEQALAAVVTVATNIHDATDDPNAEHNAEDYQAALVEGEVSEEPKEPNSVVAAKFKEKYIANAKMLGIPGKAAKRSNWDWLAQQIAAACLDEKHKIKITDFLGLLDANGVDHKKWPNRNKGWEGRLRMTGRVALQKVVGNSGVLKLADGTELPAPADFVAKFKDKE